ncbi:uncharacterized protein LOC132701183 isoform X2 [Cylas formicarius]|uniref:uncharacterized protein LOC132701183 isoform X2 n=1 Tax=Cylas formicarius TaxID=197179 RepID=UPI002958A875|nr:uncharacterized protein LOC132701183 isoform X2 [Cylas formicarius]
MSEVILLSSSEEEDTLDAPKKQIKLAPILPECTLTRVFNKNASKFTEKNDDATVLLDSDDNLECEDEILRKIISGRQPNKSFQGDEIVDLIDDEVECKKVIDNGSLVFSNELENKKHNKVLDAVVGLSSEDSDINVGENGIEKSSILINDTDDEKETENSPNDTKNDPTNYNPVNSISKSKSDYLETKEDFKKFLELVEKSVKNSQFEDIIPKKLHLIKRHFNKCGSAVTHKSFKNILSDCIAKTQNPSASAAVINFHKMYEHLKLIVGRPIEVKPELLPKLKKLQRTLKLLSAKIKTLEEAEVSWDDEDDSSYLQLHKYQLRFNMVYAKYCKYIEKNPYSGRLTHDKINFVTSSYNEINLAINREFKNSKRFPSYCEIENFITAVVEEKHLNMTESEIKMESQKCFKELGSILQKRRKAELYDCHLSFIEDKEDPAIKDASLDNTLRKNLLEGEEKIEKLCQKYVAKQDLGEDRESTESKSSSSEDDT